MDLSTSSQLCRNALASELVSLEQLQEAQELLQRQRRNSASSGEPTDEHLAAQLVALGRINRWQAEQLLAGRSKFRLGPYQIIDSIGQGGMGQVFKAEHTMMGRVVAVKVLPRSRATPEAIQGFTREIRASAQLDHENLVRAFDAGHDGNVYFLVCEYVPGADLRRLIRRYGRLTLQQSATIISQVARGLEHAHQRGLVHRDVKPGNVLVTPAGKAKLSDLGLAGFHEDLGSSDPRAGKIVGTADYLSPEQIIAPRTVTSASDIYSLGCTLYYAVTGKVPFPGGNTRDKLRRHCEDTPLNPRRFNPELDDEYLAVLCDMMEKHPARRIPTAEQVIERLAPWYSEDAVAGLQGSPPRSDWKPSAMVRQRPANEFDLADTAPDEHEFPELSPAYHSSPSQLSQPTVPVASALEETLPVEGGPTLLRRRRRLNFDTRTLYWSLFGIASLALALLLAIMAGV
ncbi:MAG: serine/threonine-protein kinase [Pirellulales bacterium]